jgi:class 3 adenylate cyclase
MEKYYKERFEAQRTLAKKLAASMEVNSILEKMREEARNLVPSAMEACILLLDPEAEKYTRPLQCALHNRPVNCLSCKRNRLAVKKALTRNKGVVVSKSETIRRQDGSVAETGPEAAIPIHADREIVGVLNVVSRPGSRFTKKDFYLIRDLAETAGNVILNAKRHWEVAQEKIKISQLLAHLSPFVPHSVRHILADDPEMLKKEKELRDVTVLFLDLEGYTSLSAELSEVEVNEFIERMFSRFVDPIHRSGGDINETAGDGLMIIFKNEGPKGNAINAVKAAFDIYERNLIFVPNLKKPSQPIHVNMGINSGSALLGMTRFSGSLDTRMTYTASGRVTNIAARLADLAEAGDILIGESTKSLIEGIWPTYARGEVPLKGLKEPVKVYSILWQTQKA